MLKNSVKLFDDPAMVERYEIECGLNEGEVLPGTFVEDMSDMNPGHSIWDISPKQAEFKTIEIASVVHGRLYIEQISALMADGVAYVDGNAYMEKLG